MHNLRISAARDRSFQNPISTPTKGIGALAVGKRKVIIGVQVVRMLPVGTRRHCEAIIKHPVAGAGNNGNYTIKDASALKICIESLVHKLPQKPSTLRNPPCCGVVYVWESELR